MSKRKKRDFFLRKGVAVRSAGMRRRPSRTRRSGMQDSGGYLTGLRKAGMALCGTSPGRRSVRRLSGSVGDEGRHIQGFDPCPRPRCPAQETQARFQRRTGLEAADGNPVSQPVPAIMGFQCTDDRGQRQAMQGIVGLIRWRWHHVFLRRQVSWMCSWGASACPVSGRVGNASPA